MTSADSPKVYPPAPWRMDGHMWFTTFKIDTDVDEIRPAGNYNVAFVDYLPGSALEYSELMVGRIIDQGPHRNFYTITDIWVDLAASVLGGREIWAVPKDLANFSKEEAVRGPLARTSWSCAVDDRPTVSAQFSDISRLAPPFPMRGRTFQPKLSEGDGDKVSSMRSRARVLPCRSNWDFHPDGPLAWLRAGVPRFSCRAYNFIMTMGTAQTLSPAG